MEEHHWRVVVEENDVVLIVEKRSVVRFRQDEIASNNACDCVVDNRKILAV